MTTRETKYVICPECDGEGGMLRYYGGGDYDEILCDRCMGESRIKVEHPDPIVLMHKEVPDAKQS